MSISISDAQKYLAGPPIMLPFRIRNRKSAFGVRRDRDQPDRVSDYELQAFSPHAGVDLIPARPIDSTSVHSPCFGEVVDIDDDWRPRTSGRGKYLHQQTITIRANPKSAGLIFRCYHVLVTLQPQYDPAAPISGVQQPYPDSNLKVGDPVKPGEVIAYISPNSNDPHLHFEFALLPDPSLSFNQGGVSLAIDPTPMLYRFDRADWPYSAGQEPDRWTYETEIPVRRLRVRPRYQCSLYEVIRSSAGDTPERTYLPVNFASPGERALADLLHTAFSTGARVGMSGRISYFFGERAMIEDIWLKP